MITESPCRIRAAPRWSSVSRNTKALAPDGLLSEMTGQLTVLFNAFAYIGYSTARGEDMSRWKSGFVGGAFLVAKRSKTADVIQDVFAAGGDMAQVPVP